MIWDGDYYYLTGFCDERSAVRTFRVDRISQQPELLAEKAMEKPDGYDVSKYTTEVFRMFSTDEPINVTLRCENCVMKSVIDKFGMKIKTTSLDADTFRTTVKVCAGPTFYRWVFGAGGKIEGTVRSLGSHARGVDVCRACLGCSCCGAARRPGFSLDGDQGKNKQKNKNQHAAENVSAAVPFCGVSICGGTQEYSSVSRCLLQVFGPELPGKCVYVYERVGKSAALAAILAHAVCPGRPREKAGSLVPGTLPAATYSMDESRVSHAGIFSWHTI